MQMKAHLFMNDGDRYSLLIDGIKRVEVRTRLAMAHYDRRAANVLMAWQTQHTHKHFQSGWLQALQVCIMGDC